MKTRKMTLDSCVTSYILHPQPSHQESLQNKYLSILKQNDVKLGSARNIILPKIKIKIQDILVGSQKKCQYSDQEHRMYRDDDMAGREGHGNGKGQDFMKSIDEEILRKTKLSRKGSLKEIRQEYMNLSGDQIVEDAAEIMKRFKQKMQRQVQNFDMKLSSKLRLLKKNNKNTSYTSFKQNKFKKILLNQTQPQPISQSPKSPSHHPILTEVSQAYIPDIFLKLISGKSPTKQRSSLHIKTSFDQLNKLKDKKNVLSTDCQNRIKQIMKISMKEKNRSKDKYCQLSSTFVDSLPSIV